jgi:hypothetical protein
MVALDAPLHFVLVGSALERIGRPLRFQRINTAPYLPPRTVDRRRGDGAIVSG